MGFVLSVLYLAISYLTPETLFGPLAAYHIELVLAILLVFVSFPALTRSFILKTPQSVALIGLAFAVFLSMLFGMQWASGGLKAFLFFIPKSFAYFFICLHCNSMKKVKVIVLMLFMVCLFVIGRGSYDLVYGVPPAGMTQSAHPRDMDQELWDMEHPYLFAMMNDQDQYIYRLRGQGEINDPNDFGQLTVCLLPLMFIFWRQKKGLSNTFLVIFPVMILLTGLVLTHSRGALVALTLMLIVAARRRVGALPSVVLAVGLFAGAMAFQFTGGRDISASAGEDRTALWGESLQLLKTHPLFGVGFGNLPEYLGHTAHNTVAVCGAELGLFGLFFWSLYLFSTAKDGLALAVSSKLTEGIPIEVPTEPYGMPKASVETMDKEEANRLGRLVVLSLFGFLVAGWFLSRAFVMTLFLLGGLVEVIYEMALQRGMTTPRMNLMRSVPYAAGLSVVLILVLYLMIRILNLVH
jgi:hypothetical protein